MKITLGNLKTIASGTTLSCLVDEPKCPACRTLLRTPFCPQCGSRSINPRDELFVLICLAWDVRTMQHRVVYMEQESQLCYVTSFDDFCRHFLVKDSEAPVERTTETTPTEGVAVPGGSTTVSGGGN